MLEQIRRNVRHPYIQALLGLVILVFIFFFGWGMRSRSPTYVAKVNGDTIDYRSYQQAYNGLLRLYQEAYRDDLTPDRIRQMGLSKRALDQLIDRTILLQEAKRRGLRVTDEELQSAIQSVQVFQREGSFSKEAYLQVLDANRLTPLEYESSKKQELLLSKVEQLIRDEARVEDSELEQEYKDRNTNVDVAYVVFQPSDFEIEVEVTDEGLQDFYEAEKEAFRSPEKRSARYVLFSPEEYLDAVEISDEEIQDEFGWRAEEFLVAEAVRARHILFRLPPGAEAQDEEALKQKAEEVHAQILAGGDFAELAKKHSEDPGSKDKGGDLGYFERGKMVPAFEEVAFSLEPGTVSEAVKTPFGYHLILVEDHRAAEEPGLETVRDQLAEDLKRRKALEEAYAAADNLLMDLEDGEVAWESLDGERQVQTTAVVAQGQVIEGVEQPQEFGELLFSLDPEKPGQLLETRNGTYLVAVAEVVPSAVPPLAEVKEEVEARYRQAEARRLAETRAREFLKTAEEQGWEDALKAAGRSAETTGSFSKKGGAIPKIGWSPDLKNSVFQIEEQGDVADEPFEVNDKLYVVRLAERNEADLAGLESEREKLRSELLPTKQNGHFQEYLEALRDKADLEINQDLLI